jgi:hypothetical protein
MNCCYSEHLTEVGVNLLERHTASSAEYCTEPRLLYRHVDHVVRDTVLSHIYCMDIYSVYCGVLF